MKNTNIFDVILNIATSLNFHDWQQNFYNRKVLEVQHIQKLKHLAIPLPKNNEFL
jgi:hypothetical protein